jgi:hypothetical protein
MAPQTVLAEIVFPNVTGLPRDQVVNSLVFNSPDGSGTLANLATDIASFYMGTPTGQTDQVAHFFSHAISRSQNVLAKFYDISAHLDGSAHGSPIQVTSLGTLGGLGTKSNGDLPNEVAICMSFRNASITTEDVPGGAPGLAGDTRPANRARGRIFLGPLDASCFTMDSSSGDSRPAPGYTALVRAAAKQYLGGSALAHNWVWSVWSRKGATITPVNQVSTDDAADTQRRRGLRATSRTTLAL